MNPAPYAVFDVSVLQLCRVCPVCLEFVVLVSLLCTDIRCHCPLALNNYIASE